MGPAPEGGEEEASTTTESKGTVLLDDGAGRRRGAPMSFRELTMIDVREVLRRLQAGQSARQVARAGVADRKTAARYLAAARACGLASDTLLDDGFVAEVAQRVQARPEPPTSEPWAVLEAQRARIEGWLRGERPLRLVRVQELLARDGVDVAYTTLRRFVHKELAWRERMPTVRIDDPPPGEEAQIDFGHVGYLPVDGVRKKLWALVVTLTVSRYMFVWTLLQQTTETLCEGLDAAWHFFDGIPKRLVPDNMSSAIVHASATDPTLQRGFLEYAQARALYIDPARVRHPQDKPRVENQIAYVRERCFDGETFETLQAWRHHAEWWSREVAGGRVHGTTRLVPRDAYEQHEKPHMQPAPVVPFDVPTWSQHKVHPDHHVQVARALYSAPTRYIGQQLDVRVDRTSVRLYRASELIKIHPRVAPGRRSTDPSDYPVGKADYALRSVDALRARARERGQSVGAFVDKLLDGPLPWTKMRQAYGLVRLCDRYGAERVDALCARALAFDVLDVARIDRMLKAAMHVESEAVGEGRVLQLPLGRFARDPAAFATRTRSSDREGGGK
jgi:transposase